MSQMQIIDALANHGAWLVLFVGAVCAAYHLIERITFRADLFAAARIATADFYGQADELFRDTELPDDLKNVLYDILLAVTKDDVGRVAFKAIERGPHTNVESGTVSGIRASIEALRRQNPDVANKFFDAARAGFASIICSHGHSSRLVTITIVKNVSEQSTLVRLAEAVERRLGEMVAAPTPSRIPAPV